MKSLSGIIFLLFFFTVSMFSQTTSKNTESKFSLGIFGGLNIPRLSDNSNNELSNNYSSRLGEGFGINGIYSLNSNFSIEADVLYSSEGGKRNGLQAIDATAYNPALPVGTYFYADFKNESIINYLELPVMVKYYMPVCKSNRFYIDLGLILVIY